MNGTLLRRLLVVLLGFGVLFGAFSLSGILARMKEPPKRKSVEKTIREVDVLRVTNKTVSNSLDIQGTLVAYDKIGIFTEVSGTLLPTDRAFKVGTYYPQGALMIKVDDEEARLSILSQKSTLLNGITQMMPDLKIDYPESFQNWMAYLEQYDVEQPLKAFPEPVNDQEKFFIASRNLYSQYYSIQSAEARLSKYKLTAPFSGVLTQVNINKGALVRAGQQLGELMKTSDYELEATVPLAELKYIQVGNRVILLSEDIEGQWEGRVKRINDQIDPTTQTIKVFISVSGKSLREGMYLKGNVNADPIADAVEIPRELLVQESQVFEVVQDTLLNLRNIEVVKLFEETAVVRGLPDGTLLLGEIFPNVYDGMRIKVGQEKTATQQGEAKPLGSLE